MKPSLTKYALPPDIEKDSEEKSRHEFLSERAFVSSSSSRRRLYNRANGISDNPQLLGSFGEAWHQQAWCAYETNEIVGSAVELAARGVARCKLRVKKIGFDACLEETDAELPHAVLRDFRGVNGVGYRSILECAATILQVSGTGYLIGRLSDRETVKKIQGDNSFRDIPLFENWQFLSDQEITQETVEKDQGSHGREKNVNFRKCSTEGIIPGVQSFSSAFGQVNTNSGTLGGGDLLDDSYHIIRIHRPSKRKSSLSDSFLKKNLTIIREIQNLTDMIEAIIHSKRTSGLLLVPSEMTLNSANSGIDPKYFEDGEPLENFDPLDLLLLDHYSDSREDFTDPANFGPLLIRGAASFLEKVRYVDLSAKLDDVYFRIRKELNERLITGLDIPKESINGLGSLNHWSGSNISSIFASQHVIPLGDFFAEQITAGYFRPELVRRGMDYSEAMNYVIDFDPANIIQRPDKASLAFKLFEMGVISEQSLRVAVGFEGHDAPNENERRQKLILQLILSSPVTLAPFLIPLLDGLESLGDFVESLQDQKTYDRNNNSGGRSADTLIPKAKDPNSPRERDGNLPPPVARKNDREEGKGLTSTGLSYFDIAQALQLGIQSYPGQDSHMLELGYFKNKMLMTNDHLKIREDLAELANGALLSAHAHAQKNLIDQISLVDSEHKVILSEGQSISDISFSDLEEWGINPRDAVSGSFDAYLKVFLDKLGRWMMDENKDLNSGDNCPIIIEQIITSLNFLVESSILSEIPPVINSEFLTPAFVKYDEILLKQ